MVEEKKEKSMEQPEEQFNIQEILFRCLVHWPWFVFSVIVCIACAWGYLRLTTPVYNISATVLIKDDKKGGSAGMLSGLESLGLDGMISSSQNIDNEIEVLRSKTIVKEVVEDLGLYISYTDKDEFPSRNMYKTSPVQVSLTPQEADLLEKPMIVEMALQPQGSLDVNVKIGDDEYQKHFEKLPAVFPTDKGTLAFFLTPDSISSSKRILEETIASEKTTRNITATINKPLAVAKGYCKNMTIEPTSKTTSVAVISLKNSNVQRGKDFINKLLEMYNINTNNDKNEVAQKTAEFINDRIAIINEELGSTEEKLENFKRQSGLMNMSDAQVYVQESSEYEKKRSEIGTQFSLMEYLKDYVNNPSHQDDVIPANIGVTDVTLSALINKYNELVLQRNRLLRSSPATNPVIVKLNNNLTAMRANITSTINTVYNGLMISKQDVDRQMKKYTNRVNSAPTQERTFTNISRQQELKSSLYLLLLKKREENSIALAATADKAKVIDSAVISGPISPNYSLMRSLSIAVGLLLPIIVITLINFFRYRIEGHSDVEKLTRVPILCDIPLERDMRKTKSSLIVQEGENANSLMTEVFCNLRTNLQFLLGKADHNVILVTSTISGEGKTFVATNLAVSLSLLDKRVVVVGLDIRRPKLLECFGFSHEEMKAKKGITNYLSSSNVDLHSLLIPIKDNSNLYILPAGTIPPNPAELIARPALDEAIKCLAEEFDYVILDSAPVGLVSDALIANRLADATLYICRADYSHKNDFELINDLKKKQKLPEMAIVVNGINMKKKKYGYYYGYGKRDYNGYYSKGK